jgi:hypothetical protein
MKDTLEKLTNELRKLDQLEADAPEREQITRMITEGERRERHAFLHDLSAFFLVACIIVGGLIQLMTGAPALFLVLQGAVLLLLPGLAIFEHRRTMHSGRWRS